MQCTNCFLLPPFRAQTSIKQFSSRQRALALALHLHYKVGAAKNPLKITFILCRFDGATRCIKRGVCSDTFENCSQMPRQAARHCVATWSSDYENEPRHYIILGSCATQAIFNDILATTLLCKAPAQSRRILLRLVIRMAWCMCVLRHSAQMRAGAG
jgi:hypothetical protein